ncbi:MAG: HlyD family efflux transporter periplasmic adaptor subunit [Nevskiaceae bacterium]|nr:MAG: HlyD family efflux transporter periplasmic adaptor subunit [Nevskiaceae bacterium]TBR73045.1 MAG: HlyD family efflux transporter periplasmic adaptor subunit [Nevskiaceae bacterium]
MLASILNINAPMHSASVRVLLAAAGAFLMCTLLAGCGESSQAANPAAGSAPAAAASASRTANAPAAAGPGAHPQNGTTRDVTVASSGDKGSAGKVLYWTDPMVPGSRFDRPGRSPFMDMDLVPVYASDPRIVEVPAAEQQRVDLATVAAEPRALTRSILTEGDVTYDERNVHDVTVRVNARVSRYYPFHRGLIVQKGRPLYELSSPEIYTYLSDFINLKSNADKVNMVSTSNSHIVQQSLTTLRWRGIPVETIETVERTGKPTDRILIRAPITGMVLERDAVQGTLINAGIKTGQFTTYGEVVAKLVDISFVYVEARLWGDQMAEVTPGMEAEIRPQGSDDVYDAKVSYVYPVLKSGQRFGIARIALDNTGYPLKPGMFAKVQIHIPPQDDKALAIPHDAVNDSAAQPFVYVKIDSTHFERRKVRVGAPVDGWVPVERGLRAGEQVVAGGGSFFLYAQQALRQR